MSEKYVVCAKKCFNFEKNIKKWVKFGNFMNFWFGQLVSKIVLQHLVYWVEAFKTYFMWYLTSRRSFWALKVLKKSTWALRESFWCFPDHYAKLTIFKIFLKINITLVYFVQFWWSLTLNGGYWCQEIDWWGSHVPLMCSSQVKHVFLRLKLLKWTPKIACRSMFYPIVPPETHTDSTGKVQ